jgi:hypothetical protein
VSIEPNRGKIASPDLRAHRSIFDGLKWKRSDRSLNSVVAKMKEYLRPSDQAFAKHDEDDGEEKNFRTSQCFDARR